VKRAALYRKEDPGLWTYKKLGEYLGMSEMGAYYALNPERRVAPTAKKEGLRQHTILLRDDEWREARRRGIKSHRSAAAVVRAILLGQEKPLAVEPVLK
jgi:hypothetical protein